jgi:hypothetical protein
LGHNGEIDEYKRANSGGIILQLSHAQEFEGRWNYGGK